MKLSVVFYIPGVRNTFSGSIVLPHVQPLVTVIHSAPNCFNKTFPNILTTKEFKRFTSKHKSLCKDCANNILFKRSF